jgi:hypothetical protein
VYPRALTRCEPNANRASAWGSVLGPEKKARFKKSAATEEVSMALKSEGAESP